MRLVLDTNVVISATLWRGPPYRLLEAVRRQANTVSVFASAPMLIELADVLSRPAAARRLANISRAASDVLADYITVAEIVEPALIQGAAPDPDDDVVIGTAVSARADLIVTGDKKLLAIGRYGQIEIVSVADAVVRLAA